MLISSRGRYALLVMIDLAGHRGGLVPGRQIAERLELSQKYLERILRTLEMCIRDSSNTMPFFGKISA